MSLNWADEVEEEDRLIALEKKNNAQMSMASVVAKSASKPLTVKVSVGKSSTPITKKNKRNNEEDFKEVVKKQSPVRNVKANNEKPTPVTLPFLLTSMDTLNTRAFLLCGTTAKTDAEFELQLKDVKGIVQCKISMNGSTGQVAPRGYLLFNDALDVKAFEDSIPALIAKGVLVPNSHLRVIETRPVPEGCSETSLTIREWGFSVEDAHAIFGRICNLKAQDYICSKKPSDTRLTIKFPDFYTCSVALMLHNTRTYRGKYLSIFFSKANGR